MEEAKSSITYSLIDPNGFPILLTFRDENPEALLKTLQGKSLWLKGNGYKPQERKSFAPAKKPLDVVPDRKCPVCGGELLNKTLKDGAKFIECVNRKYDFQTKKTTGCTFVEWPKKEVPTKVEEVEDIVISDLPF